MIQFAQLQKRHAEVLDEVTRMKVLHDAAVKWGNEMEAERDALKASV